MVVLDTNVVSELMRGSPRAAVLEWMDSQRTRDLFVTSVTEAEVRAGVAILPGGARRRGLAEAAERTFAGLFAGRVLPFDGSAARAYAEIVPYRRATGRPLPFADGQSRRSPVRAGWRWPPGTWRTSRTRGSSW